MNKNTKKYKKNIQKRINREKRQKTKKIRRILAFSSIGAIGLLFILGLVLPGLPLKFWNNDIPEGDWEYVSNMGWGILPNIDVPHDPYTSKPATSGPFLDEKWGCPVSWGYHDDILADECTLSNLARGGIMIHYKQGAPEEIVEQLKSTFVGSNVSEITIAPYNDMDNLISLTAWNYIDRLDEFDTERIWKFIDVFLNNPTLSPFYAKKGHLD
ncbi:MAG: hypothetical protein CL704_01945 [Chloroflexi bacterium]|nr:hypothetical protein [Chloroflexota bacterium]